MRIVAGIFLLCACLAHLGMGGILLHWSSTSEQDARAEAGDLSDVSGDLADEQTLQQERAKTASRVDLSSATKERAMGSLALVLGLAQAVGAVLIFARRARRASLAIVGCSFAGLGLVIGLVGGRGLLGSVEGGAALCLLVALVAAIRSPR